MYICVHSCVCWHLWNMCLCILVYLCVFCPMNPIHPCMSACVHVYGIHVCAWICLAYSKCSINIFKIWGDPQNRNLFIILYVYSYMFKLQSPSKSSPFDAMHLLRPTAQNSFRTHQFWCLLVLLLFCLFVSPVPHWWNVSLWGIPSSRETKESHLGQDQVNKEGRALGSCCFWSKTAEH